MKSKSGHNNIIEDTIVAPATAIGKGAIGIVRISGNNSIKIADKVFFAKSGKKLKETDANKIVYGIVKDFENKILDDVMATVFKAPYSYTGENSVEFFCHASSYIMNQLLMTIVKYGARIAEGGEFTKRAFLNGKMDLAQAEAVADLISSENKVTHDIAINQMRGKFSEELKYMREQLLNLASLVELELDFSEEDVEFANRGELTKLISKLNAKLNSLTTSFSLGNVLKNGIPVAIVGAVNTGKSTLLNLLVGEDKAIVSDIQGTTRDTIEETVNLNGTTFRFIDTAGIRKTKETIELFGIERTYKKLQEATIVILMLDAQRIENFNISIENIANKIDPSKQQLLIVANKIDTISFDNTKNKTNNKKKKSISELEKEIINCCKKMKITPIDIILTSLKNSDSPTLQIEKSLNLIAEKINIASTENTLITNVRHYEALLEANKQILEVKNAINNNLSTDLLAQSLKQAIYSLSTITGQITSDEILGNIFKNFCIGK